MASFNSSGSAGSSSGSSSTYTAIVPGMMAVYNQLLGLNEGNYNNILAGYQTAQGNLAGELSQVYGGYQNVEQNVMNMLGVSGGGWGVAQPAATQIRQQAAASQGQTEQQMINAGLGNTTVLANLTNQNSLFANQAYGNLGAQLAQTAAGYESQIGLAKLGAMEQGAGIQSNLAGSYLSDLSHFNFNPGVNLLGTFSKSNQSSNQVSSSYGASNGGGGGGGGYGGGGSAMNMSVYPAGYGVANSPGAYGMVDALTSPHAGPGGVVSRSYGGTVGGYDNFGDITSDPLVSGSYY